MARYREIADDLRARIQSGQYPEGSKLPGIAELMKKYQVPGLNTIRAAQQLLVEEGMLETRQGVGAFVISSGPLQQVDVAGELLQARDALTRVITALQAPLYAVTFELSDEDTSFVLTEALQNFADQLRIRAKNNDANTDLLRRWVEIADAARERIEAVLRE